MQSIRMFKVRRVKSLPICATTCNMNNNYYNILLFNEDLSVKELNRIFNTRGKIELIFTIHIPENISECLL